MGIRLQFKARREVQNGRSHCRARGRKEMQRTGWKRPLLHKKCGRPAEKHSHSMRRIVANGGLFELAAHADRSRVRRKTSCFDPSSAGVEHTTGGLDFLVVSLGGTGDTYPLLAVAIALRNRGHRVRFVANTRFAPMASNAHLDFIGYERREPIAETRVPSRRARRIRGMVTHTWLYQSLSRNGRRKRSYLGAMRWIYDLIANQSDPRRTIVVSRANSFGARLAQEKLDVPLVTVQVQPSAFRSIYDAPGLPLPTFAGTAMRKLAWSLIDAGLGCTITPMLNRFRSELGLAPVRRPFRQWMYSPDLVIGLFPDWFGPPQADWPANTHAVGFPFLDESGFRGMPQELEDFLACGEPPIIFTRGSHSRSPEAHSFFESSIEVASLLRRRAIFLAAERDWIPKDLPQNVRYFGYVPLRQLLPRAAAMVHHGGLGTTAHAFAAGIPQIAVPLCDDQPDNAARVERAGMGFCISPREYKPAVVARKLKFLLDSEQLSANCRKLAASVTSQDSLAEACRLIETFAVQSRRHQSRSEEVLQ
jgi:rhamnosyltransferase subunit B